MRPHRNHSSGSNLDATDTDTFRRGSSGLQNPSREYMSIDELDSPLPDITYVSGKLMGVGP